MVINKLKTTIYLLACIFLFSTVNAYDKTEVQTILIDITTPDGTQIEFPVLMNDEEFETEIGFKSHGLTKIEVSGLSYSEELLYHGSWEGFIYNSQPTNIVIYMIDQEVKETFNGEIPPFIKSIYVNPSSVEPGNTVFVTVTSEDLNDEETDILSYDIIGLDKDTGCSNCYGDITILENMGSRFEFSYQVEHNETDGEREFSVVVTDINDLSSAINGKFNINRQSTVHTGIGLNSHPEILHMNVSESYLYEENPSSKILAKVRDLDQDIIQFQWSVSKVEGYGTCNIDDISGEIMGILTPTDGLYESEEDNFQYLTLDFNPSVSDIVLPKTCQFDLSLTDSKGARVDGRVFLKTGPEPVNHNPMITYTYQNAMKAPPGHRILFMVMGRDLDGDDLTFHWDALYDVGTLDQSNEIKRNDLLETPFSASSTNYLTATGSSGIVRCTVVDSEGASIINEFTIEENVIYGDGIRRRVQTIPESDPFPVQIQVEDGKLKVMNQGASSSNNDLIDNNDETINGTLNLSYDSSPAMIILASVIGIAFISSLAFIGVIICNTNREVDNPTTRRQQRTTTRQTLNHQHTDGIAIEIDGIKPKVLVNSQHRHKMSQHRHKISQPRYTKNPYQKYGIKTEASLGIKVDPRATKKGTKRNIDQLFTNIHI